MSCLSEDIFLDASYRPLLSFPGNFSCELVRLFRAQQPSSFSRSFKEERKKKERDNEEGERWLSPTGPTTSTPSSPTTSISGISTASTGQSSDFGNGDRKSLLGIPYDEDERERPNEREKEIVPRGNGGEGDEKKIETAEQEGRGGEREGRRSIGGGTKKDRRRGEGALERRKTNEGEEEEEEIEERCEGEERGGLRAVSVLSLSL